MRKMIFAIALCTLLAVPAMAELISFTDGHPLSGVDGFTAPRTYQGEVWSGGSETVTIAQSYTLLNGNATVSGYENGGDALLSHRLTRGLGVNTGSPESDEVDSITGTEHIDIDFTNPYVISYVEVRSLFSPDVDEGTEYAAVAFYLNGTLVDTQYIEGVQDFDSGGNGTAAINPYIVADKIVFYVPELVSGLDLDGDQVTQAEFAVAQLNVQVVPLPGAILLGALGMVAAGWKLRRLC